MQSALQIYLFGSFRLVVEGSILTNSNWQKRKAKLLLQILALQPEYELHREALTEMLFPETDEKTASANLYRVLYVARRALEPHRSSPSPPSYLLTDGKQIRLTAANGLWVDAKEFEQQAREGLKSNNANLLECAARLYTGDLLTDEPFEQWTIVPREQLRTLFHSVLRRMAKNAEKIKDVEEEHFWLDKILSHEPADEKACRAKMRLYHRRGEHSLALKQYDKCVEALRREISVGPDKETEQLRQKILFDKKR